MEKFMKLSQQKVNVLTLHNGDFYTTEIVPFRKTNFTVYFQQQEIKTALDFRGAHSKFWLYPDGNIPYLIKNAQNKYAPAGELIISKALDMISYPHAKYHPVILLDNGIAYGTASPDIMPGRSEKVRSGDFEEISARSLASDYINLIHDEHYGVKVNYEHTVDFYISALSAVEKCGPKDLEKLRTELLKVALIQGLFLMNDLHEENLGFFKDKRTGEISIMPLYDYGSALQLDWNFTTMINRARDLLAYQGKDSITSRQKVFNRISVNKKNSLMFGIHTPLMEASTAVRTQTNTRKNTLSPDSIETLFLELAIEMKHNPEFADFYNNMKKNIDFESIRLYYANCIDPQTNESFIPSEYFDVAKATFDVTTFAMDRAIKRVNSTTTQDFEVVHSGVQPTAKNDEVQIIEGIRPNTEEQDTTQETINQYFYQLYSSDSTKKQSTKKYNIDEIISSTDPIAQDRNNNNVEYRKL